MLRKYISIIWILTISYYCYNQEVYYHISNKTVYEYLDELANLKIIELNSAVKPYTRKFISEMLSEVAKSSSLLNKRQKKELDFYLKDFGKELHGDKNFKKRLDLFYYKDSLLTFSVNPILGIQYWHSENGTNFHRWNGAEAFAYIGKHLGIYSSLRDNHEKYLISHPFYLNKRPGAMYKSGKDFSEYRGGITLSWNWGALGLVKDHIEWGNNYNYPNIFSAKPPSVAQIKLNLKPAKWLEFNYFHAWLVSEVIDSSRSYYFTNSYGSNYRTVYMPKYLAANIFTFKPLKGLHTSFGNSIIYADTDVQLAYLLPIGMFKSIDHTLGGAKSNYHGQNSNLFFDISSRQIKHLHLYATLFLDDLSVKRLTTSTKHNYFSFKYGFQVTGIIPNFFLTFEYVRNDVNVYKHILPGTTFESNLYNFGHYLQDNSKGIYVDMIIKPIRGLRIKGFFEYVEKGLDHTALGTTPRIDLPYLDIIEFKQTMFGLDICYQVINDGYLFLNLMHSNNSGNKTGIYVSDFYRGNIFTLSGGFNFGF